MNEDSELSHQPADTRVQEQRMVIYRYGPLAWVWRVFGGAALAAGVFMGVLAVRFGDWSFVLMALPLVVPAVALGWMVATRLEVVGDRIVVSTLSFFKRRVHRRSLGRAHLRLTANATLWQIEAPRLWVPVHHGLPIYLDLYAHIPNPRAFRDVLPVSPAVAQAIDDD